MIRCCIFSARFIWTATALSWLVLIILKNKPALGYLFLPGSFDRGSWRALWSENLPAVLLASWLGFVSIRLGRKILDRLGLEAAELALGLGLGAVAYGVFLAGLAGLMNAWFLGAAGAGLSLWAALDRRPRPPAAKPPVPTWACAPFSCALALAAWHALISALAPPTQWDVLAYHLAIPKLYAEWGRITEIPWLMHSHWPHLMEALYAVPLIMGRPNAAALIHALVCAAWVAAVFAAAREFLDEPTAWVGAAVLAAQPVVLKYSGVASGDGGWALFHFLGCVALWSWKSERRDGRLIAAGLLGGLGASCKLLGAIPFAVLGLWVFIQAKPARLKKAALYLACGLAAAGPWYLKAFVGSGNPVWPFLPGLFPTRWAPEPGFLRDYGPWPFNPSDNPASLLVPLAAFCAHAWIKRRPWPGFLKLLYFPLPFYLLATGHSSSWWRYAMPFFPAMALSLAWWASRSMRAPETRFPLKFLAGALVAAALSPAFAAHENNQLFAVLGLRSRLQPQLAPAAAYLGKSLDHYNFFRKSADLLRGRAVKVLLFREIRGFYLDLPYQWGDPVNQGLIVYSRIENPTQLKRRLDELGITHVLVNRSLGSYKPGAAYYDARTTELMDGTLRLYGRTILEEDGLALYELKSPG